MRIPESELIINDDGSAFHIHLKPEELADKVILVGDPGRVDMVGEFLEEKEFRHASREFVSITGKYRGSRITVLSTGIGTDNIDIVLTELDSLANVDFKTREVRPEHRCLTILRIGTTGAIQPDIPLGSFIFSEVSVGCDGLLNWYADIDKVNIPEMEEAFKKHTHWALREGLSDFRLQCLTCLRPSSHSGSENTASPTSKWKVRRWQASPHISVTRRAQYAAPLPTDI